MCHLSETKPQRCSADKLYWDMLCTGYMLCANEILRVPFRSLIIWSLGKEGVNVFFNQEDLLDTTIDVREKSKFWKKRSYFQTKSIS